MKKGIPFYFFWTGIIALIGSYWLPVYSNALSKTGWLLIILALIFTYPKVVDELKKKKEK